MNLPTDPPLPERAARARNIATGARSLPEPLRRAFVEKVCGDDSALLDEVAGLLGWVAPAPSAPAEEAELEGLLDAALPEEPAPTLTARSIEPERVRARRRTPVLLLLATALLIWLAFVVVEQSRRLAETSRDRDRAMIAESAGRAALSAAQGEAGTSRAVSDRVATILATEDPETVWRDRVAIWRLLDRGTALVEADSSITPEARARLLEALARAYRAHRLPDRADSLLSRARTLRGVGAPPRTAP